MPRQRRGAPLAWAFLVGSLSPRAQAGQPHVGTAIAQGWAGSGLRGSLMRYARLRRRWCCFGAATWRRQMPPCRQRGCQVQRAFAVRADSDLDARHARLEGLRRLQSPRVWRRLAQRLVRLDQLGLLSAVVQHPVVADAPRPAGQPVLREAGDELGGGRVRCGRARSCLWLLSRSCPAPLTAFPNRQLQRPDAEPNRVARVKGFELSQHQLHEMFVLGRCHS